MSKSPFELYVEESKEWEKTAVEANGMPYTETSSKQMSGIKAQWVKLGRVNVLKYVKQAEKAYDDAARVIKQKRAQKTPTLIWLRRTITLPELGSKRSTN